MPPLGTIPIVPSRTYFSLRDVAFGIDPSDAASQQFNEDFPQCKLVKGRYVSPWSMDTEKSVGDVLDYLWNRKQNKLHLPNLDTTSLKELIRPHEISIASIEESFQQAKELSKIPVTWIGHATTYFEMDGLRIITDPMFSERAFPVPFMGPKRHFPAGVDPSELPIDVVLLSHTHYDHLCSDSAQAIGNKALWLVPLGVKELMEDFGITNCIEMNWWDSYKIPTTNPTASAVIPATKIIGGDTTTSSIIGDNQVKEKEKLDYVEISFTPTKHWTSRHFFDRNTCLWGSFAVVSEKKNQRVFFTGDSAYCSIFKQIGLTYGPFDLALVPIGAYEPRYFLKHQHCNPEEAIKIHRDLKAKQSLAIHWGTFPLADEDVVEPALELGRCREEANLNSDEFFTTRLGETFNVGDPAVSDFASMHSALQQHYNDHVDAKQERQVKLGERIIKVKDALNVKAKVKKGIQMVKEKRDERKERKERKAEAAAKGK